MGTFRIDSIKSAARRQAWYHNNDPESRTYNFFGRYKAPRTVGDEEQQLSHVQTENDAVSPIEERRRRSHNNQEFPPPPKAGTYSGAGGPLEQREKGDDITSSGAGSKESSENAEPTASRGQPDGITEASAGPRKRKRKFALCGKAGTEPVAPSRKDSSVSKKTKKYPKLTVMGQFKAVFYSWINVLLVFAPIGIALNYAGVNKIVVFVVNFIAIIPLAAMLSYATEELAMYIGETLGGLLNATFGNAVELIVGVIALAEGQILIVQTSLIGSMLSNLLLVMGMCFFFGGLKRTEQFFNITVAQTASSLLALAIGSLIIPTAFQIFAQNDDGVTPASRGTAVMLLFVYACYLFFQLKTHADMYNEPSKKSPKRSSGKKDTGDALRAMATSGAATGAAAAGGQINQENLVHEEAEEEEEPQLTRAGAIITLAGSTVLIALCAEYMVSSIGAVAGHVSPEFIGLILLPIVGNAAEHATAVTVAIKDKMDLAIGVAVGSSLQIALLVLPLMVLLNWFGVGTWEGHPHDMTLDFDGFQVSVLFIAVILVNYLIQVSLTWWLMSMLRQY